jgi:hypothetical protein
MSASSPFGEIALTPLPARATAFHDRFFAFGETALTPLPARATAFHDRFFAFGETALTPLPALLRSYGSFYTGSMIMPGFGKIAGR